ncbi:transglutaminase-like putative cysteine protease [Paenibacillus shirakamiensis]|uniref:Transglutaminase-like putative cysteine protease n=1 Tax=Paenibacillus shirakamiensis TaxID=1265935 RepID=A0ABS4JBM6_9BACL|nr:transglutaminaseTgpA domain-containing protein [Paenibacillus shirakamiensis]MBP1999112.1 transglutaminase-like putative cysteine protease [Paenibacillus shirakamiensis]
MNKRWGMPYSWYYVISVIWILIVSFQWITFARPIWYDETSVLVLYVLCAAGAAEVLLPWNIWLKWGVKLAAIVLIHYYIMTSYLIYVGSGPLFPERFIQFLTTVLPYLWFSLPAWALFEVTVRLSVSRRFIFAFLTLNIAGFGILDSFTLYNLWPQIAWTVLAGLLILISYHFRKYQTKYPVGWRQLRLYPFKVLVNIVVVISCVLLLGINMPSIDPLLTDPYSAWHDRTGKLKVSEQPSKNGHTNSSSGYSRSDSELGGGFKYDYSPVMSISTPRGSYWRGETLSFYTGQGWISLPDDQYENVYDNKPLTPGNEVSSKVKTVKVEQTIQMLGKDTYPVLFGAFAASQVTVVEDTAHHGPSMSWSARDGVLRWNGFERAPSRQENYPTEYKLISEIPIIPVDTIKTETYSQLYGSKGVDNKYLQLQNNYPKRAKDLALDITKNGKTPYEKSILLQDYLKGHYAYSNTPSLTLKKSDDFVDSFLFEIKAGYCDYFSTSMVTMARSIGLPARWVKGFAPGHQNEGAPDLSGNKEAKAPEGPYTVTNSDAHSWAEIYFGEYGWISFEATPGFALPSVDQEAAVDKTQEDNEPEKQPQSKPEEPAKKVKQETNLNTTWIILTAVGILAAWAGYMLWRHRRALYFLRLRLRAGRSLTFSEHVVGDTNRWLAQMKRKGFTRNQHQTVREAVVRWQQDAPFLHPELEGILAIFEKAKYSPHQIEETDIENIHRLLEECYRKAKKSTRR